MDRGLANTLLGWHVWVLLHLEVLGAPKTVFSPRSPSGTLRNTDSYRRWSTRQGTDDLGILRGPVPTSVSMATWRGECGQAEQIWIAASSQSPHHPPCRPPLLIMHPILETDPLSSPDGFRLKDRFLFWNTDYVWHYIAVHGNYFLYSLHFPSQILLYCIRATGELHGKDFGRKLVLWGFLFGRAEGAPQSFVP